MKSFYSKRRYLLFLPVIAILLTALLAGCSSSPASPSPSPSPSAAQSGPVTLKVGTSRAYKTTNRFSDYYYGVLTNLTTYDSLIKLGPDLTPQPWLVRSWEPSADAKTFTFTVTDKAKWHDGVPLTAKDVQFSIKYYRDNDPQAGWMKDVIQDVQVDGNKVILNLSRPYGNLLTEFMTYSVIPQHIWEKVKEPLKYDGQDMTVGSGPFKFSSWDAAAGKFIFTANPDYFQGKPKIDRLEVDVYKNMDALVMALSKGEIDTWWDYSGTFSYSYIPGLLKSGNIDFASATYLGVPAAIGFNLKRSPLDSPDFRKAVANAINYQQIIDSFYSGYGTLPTYGFVPPTHNNFDQSIPKMEYKPDAAKGLLDSLGLKDTTGDGVREGTDGKTLALTLLTRSDVAVNVRICEMVKDLLSKVGITVQIKAVDQATWTATKDKMDYDLVFFGATPWGTLTHAAHGSAYFDSRRTGAGVLANLSAPDYLAACDARLSTGNAQEQAKADLKIQQLTYQYLPGIALAWIDSVYPYKKGWSNWQIDGVYGGVVNSFSWSTVTPPK